MPVFLPFRLLALMPLFLLIPSPLRALLLPKPPWPRPEDFLNCEPPRLLDNLLLVWPIEELRKLLWPEPMEWLPIEWLPPLCPPPCPPPL